MKAPDRVLLAHGGGGHLTRQLVEELFLPALQNPHLATLTDAAVLPEMPPGRPALSTDAFVVDPPIFSGGDLGCLSICGTVNDLAMSGARPLWLTWALILEEGADGDLLETCVRGAASAAKDAGVTVVAGDTKVVPRGKGDGLFAVTAGLGVVPPGRDLSDTHIEPGDAILVSGPIGDHGATVLAHRHDLLASGLKSDCAPLGRSGRDVVGEWRGGEGPARPDPGWRCDRMSRGCRQERRKGCARGESSACPARGGGGLRSTRSRSSGAGL